MQAIITRYLPPSDHKGTRISASCKGGRVVLPYNYELDDTLNHFYAAMQLSRKMGWADEYTLASGTLPNGDTCHVLCANRRILGSCREV